MNTTLPQQFYSFFQKKRRNEMYTNAKRNGQMRCKQKFKTEMGKGKLIGTNAKLKKHNEQGNKIKTTNANKQNAMQIFK